MMNKKYAYIFVIASIFAMNASAEEGLISQASEAAKSAGLVVVSALNNAKDAAVSVGSDVSAHVVNHAQMAVEFAKKHPHCVIGSAVVVGAAWYWVSKNCSCKKKKTTRKKKTEEVSAQVA